MTVAITGDVHHAGMETRDQSHLAGTELEAAVEYAEIAATYDVPVTLFLTGKCIAEDRERVERLAAMDNVEIGGHNYWAFTTPVHDAWRALEKATDGRIGSWNGPRPFQSWEIRKTLAAFLELGVSVRAWRDHAYRHDRHTADLLATYGVSHFSDAVEPTGDVRRADGLTVVPINTPPDHEHVYHAFRTPEQVTASDFEGPFGTASMPVEEWRTAVFDQIADHCDAGRHATVLAHPACMRLADDFETFDALCAKVSSEHRPVRVSRVGARD